MKIWNREPALVVAFAAAVIALAIGFGVPVTAAQEALIMTFVIAGMGLLTRSQVTPVPPAG
jgi:hypothetical protein